MSTAKQRYDVLKNIRDPFLRRARDAAALTIPSLIPPEGHNGTSDLPDPNQGLGARLVVHLAAYLMSALLPPGRKIFRLGVTPEVLLQSQKAAPDQELEAQLAQIETIPHREISRRDWRTPTDLSIQHLLVSGSVLEQMLPDNSIIIHPLSRFVVVRDPSGRLIEFIVEQPVEAHALPDRLKALRQHSDPTPGSMRPCLYTWGVLKDGQWEVHQELDDVIVPDSDGRYDEDRLPFFALRWAAVANEDYGRSKVEAHIADLRTYDGLSKALRDGASMASRNITMIRPNATAGLNLQRKLAKANNGEFVIGNPEDVSMLQFQNVSGLQIVQAELGVLRQELGSAFMLTSGSTRDAERVTAEEIRRVGQELDSVQGGAFSMLSGSMMRARVSRLLYQMRVAGQLPQWDDTQIDPTILTGLEALGREAETAGVAHALQLLQGYPPEAYTDYIKWDVMLRKGFTGLDLSDAVRPEAEVNAIRQQRQQQEMMAQMAASAAGPVAQAVAQGQTQ